LIRKLQYHRRKYNVLLKIKSSVSNNNLRRFECFRSRAEKNVSRTLIEKTFSHKLLICFSKLLEVTYNKIIPFKTERDDYYLNFIKNIFLKIQRFLIRIFQPVKIFSSCCGKARISATAALDFFCQIFNQGSCLINAS